MVLLGLAVLLIILLPVLFLLAIAVSALWTAALLVIELRTPAAPSVRPARDRVRTATLPIPDTSRASGAAESAR